MPRSLPFMLAVLAVTALAVAACGGGEATPTPAPSPTAARPAPTATPGAAPTTAPAPTATRPAPTATLTPPTPTPTPAPGQAVPTPIVNTQGRRGGVLNLSASPDFFTVFDTFSNAGASAIPVRAPMLNNLLWNDPYNPEVLVGDVAQGWVFADGGKSITFTLRKGIKFHDGTALTARDVVYAIERAWKPRSPTMTAFRGKLDALQAVEAPDDSTVKLTLSRPSNFFLQALGTSGFLMYPAHLPFPEKEADFKKTPIGTGPFKHKAQDAGVKLEYVRNEEYWKPGLPYLDGVTMFMLVQEPVLAAFRTGRLDAVSLDHPYIDNFTDSLEKETGFIKYPINTGLYGPHLNQRAPWTDARVRQAYSLALDRPTLLQVWVRGRGTPYASPLPPPELSGQWGISVEEMKKRPGFAVDKAADVAAGKKLLAEAGVDPSKVTVEIVFSIAQSRVLAEVVDSAARSLGFKTRIEVLEGAAVQERLRAGSFDIYFASMTIQADDPGDYLAPWVITGGGSNHGKWSNPKLDALFAEQDATQDVARRKQLIRDLQEEVLAWNVTIPMVWRGSYKGHQPWVKNYPHKTPFTFSPKFRWEQVWLER